MEIQKGQVWRKLGPYDWLKVDMIRDPRYPEYDGGLIGCEVTFYPPQKKVINLRGGELPAIEMAGFLVHPSLF